MVLLSGKVKRSELHDQTCLYLHDIYFFDVWPFCMPNYRWWIQCRGLLESFVAQFINSEYCH